MRPDSVREARREAGLSLAQVAGDDLSRTAIHLIETGKSRPSPKTLALIARRTGKSLDFFVPTGMGAGGGQLDRLPDLDSVADLIQRGQFDAAVAQGSSLAREIPANSRAGARARFLLGWAQVMTSAAPEAEANLRQAVEWFTGEGDQLAALNARVWLAKALCMRQDQAGVAIAREALEAVRRLEPAEPLIESELLQTIGTFHISRHEYAEAIAAYDEALVLADSMRDLQALATTYDNLRIAHYDVGNLERAGEYSRKALALWNVGRDERVLARLENNMGVILLKQGRLDEAEEHLTNALHLCERLRLDQGSAHVLLSLGELFLERGVPEAADRFLEQAADVSRGLGERFSEGVAHMVLGRSAAISDDPLRVVQRFEQALEIFREVDAPKLLNECRILYARALRQVGMADAALDQWEAAVGWDRAPESDFVPSLMVG